VERLNQWIALAANLGVIIGVVVVAYEIRVNTNAVRSATYQGFIDSSFSWADTMVDHAPELAEIMQQGSIENLTPEQQLLWTGFALKAITTIESNYLHHRAGSLDDDVFEGRTRGSVKTLLLMPMLLQSFQSGNHFWAEAEFRDDFAARLEAAQSQ
jgi:hypothetical protein